MGVHSAARLGRARGRERFNDQPPVPAEPEATTPEAAEETAASAD